MDRMPDDRVLKTLDLDLLANMKVYTLQAATISDQGIGEHSGEAHHVA